MHKIIIITGANRGLGKALVDVALKDKDQLIISISRSLNEQHRVISDANLLFIKTDLAEPFSDSIIDTIARNSNAESTLYFFNNASIIVPIDRVGSLKEFDIETSIKVNVQYPISFINSLLSQFKENRVVLVNISSGAGNNPIPYWSLYGASKAYMNLFFKVLEEENRENSRISVYTIDPGVMDTGMQKHIREISFPKQDYFKTLKEDNKLIKPEDAALRIFNEINYYE